MQFLTRLQCLQDGINNGTETSILQSLISRGIGINIILFFCKQICLQKVSYQFHISEIIDADSKTSARVGDLNASAVPVRPSGTKYEGFDKCMN